MKGFQDRFVDLPDYILRITKEIWEDRGLATLHHYYAPDLTVRSPGGIVRGNAAVIDATLTTLAEFPDRLLLGEDVIWCGDEDAGFLSSHRVVTSGTHTGHGPYGPPTGKSFSVRVIADCAARGDVIYDEWLVRDSSGIVRQLGFEPQQFARDLIVREGGPDKAARPLGSADDVVGGYTSRGNDNEWGARLATILADLMRKDFAVVRREYDRAVRTEHPGAEGGWSYEFAETRWMRLRSSFPSARFDVHHVIGRSDEAQPHRAAVRWSLEGKHDGYGAFGAPSGAPVHIMGMTHAEFGPWGLRREFTLYDEVSVWKQILLHSGVV